MDFNFNEAKNHIMNTYGRLDLLINHGKGVYLYDSENNKYLDFTSGIGVNSLGYGNEKWLKAIQLQMNKLVHCSNIFNSEPATRVAKKLTELSGMSRIFFSNSGAEANEGAIKLARKYSYENYGEGRNTILTLKQSFHGRTITTLKATGQDKFHKFFYPFTEGFNYVIANDLDDFKSKLNNDVCAIMLEAIQGEGGVIPLDEYFVKKVVKICNEKDILVIFDEVQCGIARTGKIFGYENFNVKPDIITVAKGLGAGLPIGGFLCNDKLKDVLKPGDHGSTFGGNPLICAGTEIVLDELCNKESYNKITENGIYLKSLISKSNNPQILDIRGMGLMIGIKVKCSPKDVQTAALEKGLLVLTAGTDVVRLLPPLIISKEEIKKGIDILLEVLSDI